MIASITMPVVVPCASLAAFVLARFSFKGREAVYIFFTLGLLFPVAVAILPLFISLRSFGLINSWFGVALPQAAFALPTTIIVLRPFFRSIPAELEEAAAIDGCGPFRFFWKIVLPLSRPVLATVSVVAIVASWNAFLLPLIVLNDPDLWTLPLGVQNFSTQYSSDTARVLAFTSLSMVPALVVLRRRRAPDRQRAGVGRGQGLNGGALAAARRRRHGDLGRTAPRWRRRGRPGRAVVLHRQTASVRPTPLDCGQEAVTFGRRSGRPDQRRCSPRSAPRRCGRPA